MQRGKIKCMTDEIKCKGRNKGLRENKRHKELRRKMKVKEEINGAVSI